MVHSSPVFFDFAKSLDDLQAVLLSFEDIINSRAEQLRSGILISTIFIDIFIVFMVPVLPEKYFTTEFSGYIPSRPVPEVLKIYNMHIYNTICFSQYVDVPVWLPRYTWSEEEQETLPRAHLAC